MHSRIGTRPGFNSAAAAIRQMRNYGELDVWNDAREGGSSWYGMTQAEYQRGDLTREQWEAYCDGYAAATRARQVKQTPAVSRLELHEDEGGFVWGASSR